MKNCPWMADSMIWPLLFRYVQLLINLLVDPVLGETMEIIKIVSIDSTGILGNREWRIFRGGKCFTDWFRPEIIQRKILIFNLGLINDFNSHNITGIANNYILYLSRELIAFGPLQWHFGGRSNLRPFCSCVCWTHVCSTYLAKPVSGAARLIHSVAK